LSEAYDLFKEAIAPRKPSAQRQYKRHIERHFLPKFAHSKRQARAVGLSGSQPWSRFRRAQRRQSSQEAAYGIDAK